VLRKKESIIRLSKSFVITMIIHILLLLLLTYKFDINKKKSEDIKIIKVQLANIGENSGVSTSRKNERSRNKSKSNDSKKKIDNQTSKNDVLKNETMKNQSNEELNTERQDKTNENNKIADVIQNQKNEKENFEKSFFESKEGANNGNNKDDLSFDFSGISDNNNDQNGSSTATGKDNSCLIK